MTSAPLTDRGRRTRDALLVAAREVFEAKGFSATRMSDIADAAGVSHGTVYTWFDSKESLLGDLVGSLVGQVREAIRVPQVTDPVARIELANRRYLDAYRANARLLAVVEQVATTDEHFAGVLAGLRRTHVERVARDLARLQSDGAADPDLDPHAAAAALCAMVEGFARHWLGRGEPHDEETAVATLTTLWAHAVGLGGGTAAAGPPGEAAVGLGTRGTTPTPTGDTRPAASTRNHRTSGPSHAAPVTPPS